MLVAIHNPYSSDVGEPTKRMSARPPNDAAKRESHRDSVEHPCLSEKLAQQGRLLTFGLVRRLDHFDCPTEGRLDPIDQARFLATLCPQALKARKLFWASQGLQQRLPTFAVLHRGDLHLDFQQEPLGIDQEMAVASVHLFACIIASPPPFSLGLTDCLSITAALGSASRSSFIRICSRSPRLIGSHLPSRRHWRK
jgi:hypothetical protein